ncbi:MAG: glutamate-1-semialdehyde 2,1-aminomutase [Gammaproteobacteria bacterium]
MSVQFHRSKQLQKLSHTVIPGGAHTYAKGDDQYPELAPGFIVRGKGCRVWDVDGNEFIEYGMGLRSVTLGHAYEPVLQAAWRQMQLGSNFNRPAAIELECAEKLLSLMPNAEMVKFAKNGSDVNSAAVKLARAYTGRDMVAICAEHAFFSVDDWFIGSTAMSAGIPKVVQELTVKFNYNDLESLRRLFQQHPQQLGCVVMEAETTDPPRDGFLRGVQRLCREHGAVFILDEIITGFRWHLGGAQTYHDIVPDLSAFGKALGNGFSVAALVGRRELMKLGGLDHDKPRTFLLSTTFGAETCTLAAALATMEIYHRENVVEHLWQKGERLAAGVNKAIAENHLQAYFELVGKPCNLIYVTRDQEENRSQEFRALFLQETIKRGLLMPSLVVSYSHTDADIDRTISAISEALTVYAKALAEGVEKYLVGSPVKPVFRKYN